MGDLLEYLLWTLLGSMLYTRKISCMAETNEKKKGKEKIWSTKAGGNGKVNI